MTLKDLRLQNKKTVKEVAERLGVRPQTVCNYERGIRGIDVLQFFVLCELYGESPEEMMKAYIETRNQGSSVNPIR